MGAQSSSRLIGLVAVAKSFAEKGRVPNVVFRPTTISLPTDRRLAVLGGKSEGKTVLLQLLAGTEKPDVGSVITPPGLSPVVNSDRIFHRDLSVLENIRFYARRFLVDEVRLMQAIDRMSPLAAALERRAGDLTMRERRGMEAALAMAFGFDCYLVDDIDILPTEITQRTLAEIARRGAGLIFATDRSRLARQFADCAVVIQDHTLHPFARIEEATRFYERE
jgi:capsular polysaccharide transport system ATP-binding protein